MDKEEIRYINIQFYTLFFSLLGIIISIILTYNEKLEREDKKTLFSKKTNYNTNLFNRILFLVIACVFLYVNIKSYLNAKTKDKNLRNYQLQIITSMLTISAALISLYIIATSSKETVANLENPII